jgi:hypothetical protein
MEIIVVGELLKDAAGNESNMVSEVEGGKASVEELCDADEREKQEYSFKKLRKNNVIKPFYFQLHTSQNEIQTPELLSATFMLTGTRYSHLYGHSKIRTGAGHRLVCWICGAGLMTISKCTFC